MGIYLLILHRFLKIHTYTVALSLSTIQFDFSSTKLLNVNLTDPLKDTDEQREIFFSAL